MSSVYSSLISMIHYQNQQKMKNILDIVYKALQVIILLIVIIAMFFKEPFKLNNFAVKGPVGFEMIFNVSD